MALLEPTNLLLLACALIYGLIGESQEAWILLGFVVAICLLDGWQQHRSRRALAELARLSSPRARVRREGIDLELAPEEVRVGDLLRWPSPSPAGPVLTWRVGAAWCSPCCCWVVACWCGSTGSRAAA